MARARWRVLRKASGLTSLAGLGGEAARPAPRSRPRGGADPQVQDPGVAVLGRARLVGLEPGEHPVDDRLAPDAVVFEVGDRGVGQVARGQGLELPAAEVVDDQAVQDRPEVVAEAPLGVVGPGELVVQELDPELLEDLVGEVRVAELEPEVALDRVVIAADQVAHRGLALGARARGPSWTSRQSVCSSVSRSLPVLPSAPAVACPRSQPSRCTQSGSRCGAGSAGLGTAVGRHRPTASEAGPIGPVPRGTGPNRRGEAPASLLILRRVLRRSDTVAATLGARPHGRRGT